MNKTSVFLTLGLVAFALTSSLADTVIMKDGTVYKGKILIDTDKAVLIGQPPFGTTSYLLQAEDIAKIIYEEYHPDPPAIRKRGFVVESRLDVNAYSSADMSAHPTASLYGGIGFRVHPFFEIDGGLHWAPVQSGDLTITTAPNNQVAREYSRFWLYGGEATGRFYPFFQKQWKTEPYVLLGYDWNKMTPKGSGDSLTGSGPIFGFGVMKALTKHWFFDARFVYHAVSYGSIQFLGQDASLDPDIVQHTYSLGAGISYRL